MTPKRTSFVYLTFLSTFLVTPSLSTPLPMDMDVADASAETAMGPSATDQPVDFAVDRNTPSALAFAAFLTAPGPDGFTPSPATAYTFSVTTISSQAETVSSISTALSTPTTTPAVPPTDLGLESPPATGETAANTAVLDGIPSPTAYTPSSQTPVHEPTRTTLFLSATFSSPTPSASSGFVSSAVFHTKSLSPLGSAPTDTLNPANAPVGKSQATENSRSATIVGVFLALGTIMSLMIGVYCLRFRLPCMRRENKRALSGLLDLEKSRPSTEKASLTSPKGSRTVILPDLPSIPPPALTSPDAKDGAGQEWYFPATAHFEGFTEYLSNGPFTEVSLSSVSEIRSSALSDRSYVPSTVDRTSLGAASLTAVSFSTCESRYSSASNKLIGEAERVSALIKASKLQRPESAVLAPWAPLAPATRTRSKTLVEPGSPPSENLSSSKSFPENFLMLGNRWSQESSRSRRTDRSSDSEWDVAQAYGRFSKESLTPGTDAVYGLATIMEDSEHVESVDVGGKTCLLVKGQL